MSIFPDRNGGPTKEEVLDGTPYLRTFLDRTAQRLNPEKWQSDLNVHDTAIEKELDHGSLKRVAFLLEFPDHIIDRANPFLEGFVKAYDLATSSGERRAPLNQASFMYVCG